MPSLWSLGIQYASPLPRPRLPVLTFGHHLLCARVWPHPSPAILCWPPCFLFPILEPTAASTPLCCKVTGKKLLCRQVQWSARASTSWATFATNAFSTHLPPFPLFQAPCPPNFTNELWLPQDQVPGSTQPELSFTPSTHIPFRLDIWQLQTSYVQTKQPVLPTTACTALDQGISKPLENFCKSYLSQN